MICRNIIAMTVFMIVFLPLSGCGAISYHQKSVDSCIDRIAETRRTYENKYLGKSKGVLIEDFGKPSVRYDVFSEGVNYEEEWSFITSGGWLGVDCAGSVCFYIKDGKIADVSVW